MSVTPIKLWLDQNDRSAAWLGRQMGLGSSGVGVFVNGQKVPSLTQRIAIEAITVGGVSRDVWGRGAV